MARRARDLWDGDEYDNLYEFTDGGNCVTRRRRK